MTDEKPRVIIIPPKPELQQTAAVTKQLRVAAYCRVSTKEEEQASSYEAQCEYSAVRKSVNQAIEKMKKFLKRGCSKRDFLSD